MSRFRCPNCGEEISTTGIVCPFCGFDKRAHAEQYNNSIAGGCAGLIIGGFTCWMIGNALWSTTGAVLFSFIGAFVSAAVAGNVARVMSAPDRD